MDCTAFFMKQIAVSSLLVCSLLAACTPTKRTYHPVAPFPRETEQAISPDTQLLEEQGVPAPTPAPKLETTPAPTPQPRVRNAVYAIPEPGKPGFARSPYNPNAGLIDCRGNPPGMEIKDPFTEGKILLVP